MNAVWTIAMKDLKLLLRNRAAFFWVLGFPILIALFFGSISGGGRRAPLSIAIVDLDGTDYSRAIAARLRASDALKVEDASLDSARTSVRKGDRVAYVALHAGAGKSFGFGSDSTGGIEIGVDPRRTAEKEYLRGLVTAALFETMRGSFSSGYGKRQIEANLESLDADPALDAAAKARTREFYRSLETFLTVLDSSGFDTGAATAGGAAGAAGAGAAPSTATQGGGPNIRVVEVAETDSGPRSAFEVTFPSSIAWALIGVCMSFAISIVSERVTGTFLRLRLAPVSRSQVLAGKGLACFLASIASVSALLAIGIALFHVRVSNPGMLAAAIAASAFCFTGLMMLVSTLGRTHQSVSGAGWAIMLVMSMTGGGMIPLIAMPAWMQSVSNFSLVKWSVLSVEASVWRGFGWGELLPVLAIPVAAGLVGIWLGTRALQASDG